MLRLILIPVLVVSSVVSLFAQTPSRTYPETRKLLLKMERAHENRILKKLFEQAEARESDLIQALYDPEQKVSLNAQVVIKYLGKPQMLAAVEEWYDYRKKLGKDYWMPKIELASEVRYLEGDRDLSKLVLKNLYRGQQDVSAKLVAYNENLKTALIEVSFGNVFTEGRHVAIRQENGRWRLLSENLVWQS